MKCVGALTVVNSSMTSMRSFAHLVSICTNAQRTAVKAGNYEVVVSGLLSSAFNDSFEVTNLFLNFQATMSC